MYKPWRTNGCCSPRLPSRLAGFLPHRPEAVTASLASTCAGRQHGLFRPVHDPRPSLETIPSGLCSAQSPLDAHISAKDHSGNSGAAGKQSTHPGEGGWRASSSVACGPWSLTGSSGQKACPTQQSHMLYPFCPFCHGLGFVLGEGCCAERFGHHAWRGQRGSELCLHRPGRGLSHVTLPSPFLSPIL